MVVPWRFSFFFFLGSSCAQKKGKKVGRGGEQCSISLFGCIPFIAGIYIYMGISIHICGWWPVGHYSTLSSLFLFCTDSNYHIGM